MRHFLLLLLSFRGLLLVALALSTNFQFDLHPPLLPLSAEQRLEHYRAIVAKDFLRHRQMSYKRHAGVIIGGSERRQAWESSKVPDLMSNTSRFEMPMLSGMEYAGVGMYLVVVRIGTPAMPFSLVLDTASTLTWINCRLRRRRGRHHAHVPGAKDKKWYRPALSLSWRRHRCSAPLCATLPFSTTECPRPSSSCLYEYLYNDGTRTLGIYGQDKATVALYGGRMAKLPGLVIGCSTFSQGSAVAYHDGILSLGNHEISFGVHAASRFGGRFSFCLLGRGSSHNTSSYLTFGPNPAINTTDGEPMMETPLIFYDPSMEASYGATVTGISIDGELLPIPPEVWDEKINRNGIIIDTGTTITGLIAPAYSIVTSALHQQLATLPRVLDIFGFEFCYNWTKVGNDASVNIPKLVVHFKDAARLEPDAKSYVLADVIPGVNCLGFNRLPEGPSIIGNILMQEHLWEFNLINAKLRFKKSSCLSN